MPSTSYAGKQCCKPEVPTVYGLRITHTAPWRLQGRGYDRQWSSRTFQSLQEEHNLLQPTPSIALSQRSPAGRPDISTFLTLPDISNYSFSGKRKQCCDPGVQFAERQERKSADSVSFLLSQKNKNTGKKKRCPPAKCGMPDSPWQSSRNITGSAPVKCGTGIRTPLLFAHICPEIRCTVARGYGRVWPSHNTQHRQRQTDAVLQTEALVVYNPCMSGRTGATIQSGSDQDGWLPIHHRSAVSLMESYLHFICTVNIRTGYTSQRSPAGRPYTSTILTSPGNPIYTFFGAVSVEPLSAETPGIGPAAP